MSDNHNRRVCPVERAGHLDSKIRRWLQNPQKLLGPYLQEGMTVMDVGCGPGLYSIEMARMVGKTGHVIAVDLQAGMLQKLNDKVEGTELEERITLHLSTEDKIGFSGRVDFVLAFYMVHELPDQDAFFSEIATLLKPSGKVLVVEPPLHVSKKAFEKTVRKARNAGLRLAEKPKVFFGKSAVFKKTQH